MADATGLTVRTLHHYHEIGLLTPSGRNSAGHRLYTSADVRRLYQIRALRGFGLSLAEIADVLADAVEPRELLRRQLAQVDERIAAAQRLRRNLHDVLGALERHAEWRDIADMVSLIEVMTTVERKLTPQEVQDMTEARARFAAGLSEEELAAMSRDRAEQAAKLSPAERAAMAARRAAMMPTESTG